MIEQQAETLYYPGFGFRPGDTVVDVGCGDGAAVEFAGRVGAEVIGIDCDPACIEQLAARMKDVPARGYRGIVSDCDPIPLPDGTADVVVCTEVLEHVPDPIRLASELARIGKDGARYLVSVPTPASESIMRRVAPEWYWRPPYHLRVFDPGELDLLLEAAGLAVTARWETGCYWAMWWAFRMLLNPAPGEPVPDSPLLKSWDATWIELNKTEAGQAVGEALNRLLPKSQLRIATKNGPVRAPGQGGGSRWARRVRRLIGSRPESAA